MTGRPPIFETPEQFEEMADAYFSECEEKGRRPTVNGLCLALGVNSRQTLLNYEDREGFLDVVKRTRMRLENAWEQALSEGKPTGAIFWLKNQGWKDSVETVHGGAVEFKNISVGFRDG